MSSSSSDSESSAASGSVSPSSVSGSDASSFVEEVKRSGGGCCGGGGRPENELTVDGDVEGEAEGIVSGGKDLGEAAAEGADEAAGAVRRQASAAAEGLKSLGSNLSRQGSKVVEATKKGCCGGGGADVGELRTGLSPGGLDAGAAAEGVDAIEGGAQEAGDQAAGLLAEGRASLRDGLDRAGSKIADTAEAAKGGLFACCGAAAREAGELGIEGGVGSPGSGGVEGDSAGGLGLGLGSDGKGDEGAGGAMGGIGEAGGDGGAAGGGVGSGEGTLMSGGRLIPDDIKPGETPMAPEASPLILPSSGAATDKPPLVMPPPRPAPVSEKSEAVERPPPPLPPPRSTEDDIPEEEMLTVESDSAKAYEQMKKKYPDATEEELKWWSSPAGFYMVFEIGRPGYFHEVWANEPPENALASNIPRPGYSIPSRRLRDSKQLTMAKGAPKKVLRSAMAKFAKDGADTDSAFRILPTKIWVTQSLGHCECVFLNKDNKIDIAKRGNKPLELRGNQLVCACENSFRFGVGQKRATTWTPEAFRLVVKSLSEPVVADMKSY